MKLLMDNGYIWLMNCCEVNMFDWWIALNYICLMDCYENDIFNWWFLWARYILLMDCHELEISDWWIAMSLIYLIDGLLWACYIWLMDCYELDMFDWKDCYELDKFDYELAIFDEIGSSAAASLLYTSILLVITSHSFSLVAFLLSIWTYIYYTCYLRWPCFYL